MKLIKFIGDLIWRNAKFKFLLSSLTKNFRIIKCAPYTKVIYKIRNFYHKEALEIWKCINTDLTRFRCLDMRAQKEKIKSDVCVSGVVYKIRKNTWLHCFFEWKFLIYSSPTLFKHISTIFFMIKGFNFVHDLISIHFTH